MTRHAKPGKWCNEDVAVAASVVTADGGRSRGVIVRWTGPAECVLDNGVRGILAETYDRRTKP